jgi:hypothetical protein
MVVRRSTFGLRPVGDLVAVASAPLSRPASLVGRPVLFVPRGDPPSEPFLHAKNTQEESETSKESHGKLAVLTGVPHLTAVLLEYNLRKCILFKDSMIRQGARFQ